MTKIMNRHILLAVFFISICVGATAKDVVVGAERTSAYVNELKGKRVALVANQTSVVGETHLIDTLKSMGVNVVVAFAPEHGLRGKEDAGAKVASGIDAKTGVKVTSIYGRTKKPTKKMMDEADVVVFDIQDVGARFYTYISTLHYVMEACAEEGKKMIVLDRPNPNDFVDGPVLKDSALRSFVGVDRLPVLHGCTVGELARMINGEGWLKGGVRCDLKVVRVRHWRHGDKWSLRVKPSPNLPNDDAVRLYPSLCLFEGTNVSVGRGTGFPFQVMGYPDKSCDRFGFSFTPQSIKGMDSNPMHKGLTCYGADLRQDTTTVGFDLRFIMKMHELTGDSAFWGNRIFFDKLAGTSDLRRQITEGVPEMKIRQSWEDDLREYRKTREKYLMY